MPIHNCRNNVQKTHGRPIQMSIMIFWLWRVRNHQRFLNTWIHNLFSQLSSKLYYLLYSSNFLFLFFDRFWQRSYKIWKYYVILVYNLQGKMEKNWKENHATEVTEIPKDKNTGWTKQKTPRMTGCTIRIFNHQSLKSYQLRLFYFYYCSAQEL